MKEQSFYAQQINLFKVKRDAAKRRDTLLSSGRLFSGLSMLVALYFALLQQSFFVFIFFILSLTFFVVLVLWHQRLRKQIKFLEVLIKINQDELAYLNGDLLPFHAGGDFISATHPYTKDLDIFGSGSLFQRINRSKNPVVQALLAKRLENNDLKQLHLHQQIVQQLAPEITWRQSFMAKASEVTADPAQLNALFDWFSSKQDIPKWSNPIVLWILTLWFPLLSLIIGWQFGWAGLDFLIYPFLLNLTLFFATYKSIKRDHQAADQLAKVFEVYGELITLLDQLPTKNPTVLSLLSPLKDPEANAGKALSQLAYLLSRMDTIFNVFGSMLLNGTIFYHWHVYKRILHWKAVYGHKLASWVSTVNELETYLSLANYAYNHPRFSYPSLAKEAGVYKAQALAHPFLSDSKRVANDIDFEQMKVLVLTGSNMAGKSTFLRSVGLSMVMAAIGLPVCAESLHLSEFNLLSSMKPEDDVNADTSYFQAEVERLRRLMDRVEEGEACFLLLDEILRGTNSDDKRQGTRAFLIKLNQHNIKCIAATHDVDIADLTSTNNSFEAMYFESGYDGNALTFDYKLRKGVCNSPNATQLLRLKKLID